MEISQEWYHTELLNSEQETLHRAPNIEYSFYNAVRAGDMEAVTKNCKEDAFIDLTGTGILSRNPLNNIKYHFVVTAAMLTRYCIDGGLEPEQAYRLSDFYILKMDKCKTVEQISRLHDTMCVDLCNRMNELKRRHILSKPIVLCMDYIYSHIHYRITIKELSEYLHLSESYLSKLFLKEMGIPLSHYIVDLKIEKSKNLLQYSDYSIVEIANYFSFSSQSHFIQVFQKKTGITPYKYRMMHFRSNWEEASKN